MNNTYAVDIKIRNEIIINQLIKDLKVDTNKVSDGYHTFKELYDHRIALFIALCSQFEFMSSELGRNEGRPWKSKLHHDGSSMDGWFIMGLFKDKGEQISYHLPNEYWDKLSWVEVLDKAPEWDGHTPEDVVKRLQNI